MVLHIDDGILQELTVSGPSTDEEIRDAERELGVIFPPEYREFLARYGAALMSGYDIAGLSHEDPNTSPMFDDVVRMTRTLRDRHGKVAGLDNVIPISGDGMDVLFYLETKGEDSGKILALGPSVEKHVANSFSEFIAKIHAGDLNP